MAVKCMQTLHHLLLFNQTGKLREIQHTEVECQNFRRVTTELSRQERRGKVGQRELDQYMILLRHK